MFDEGLKLESGRCSGCSVVTADNEVLSSTAGQPPAPAAAQHGFLATILSSSPVLCRYHSVFTGAEVPNSSR